MNNKNDGQATGPGREVWVKASTRVPDEFKDYCIKSMITGSVVYKTLTYSGSDNQAEAWRRFDYEWLDESALSALLAEVTRLREENERFREALATILHESSGYIRPVAIKVIKKVAANSLSQLIK